MPHLECVADKTRLYSAGGAADLVGDRLDAERWSARGMGRS
jgi:hypothetical protein